MKVIKAIVKDLYERIIKNWRSSLSGVLIAIALIEWRRGDVTTDEFITFIGAIGSIIALLYNKNEG